MKYKTVGGQSTGVGADFASTLQGLLTGSMGSGSAVGQTNASGGGVSGVLNNLLSAGAGTVGGAMATQINQQKASDLATLNARFGAGGGTAFGTPGAYADASYLAQETPAVTTAIGNLQLGAIGQIMPALQNIYNRTTPQAETVGQQNPWVQGIGMATNLIAAANPFGSHSSNYDPYSGAAPQSVDDSAQLPAGYGGPLPAPSYIPNWASAAGM